MPSPSADHSSSRNGFGSSGGGFGGSCSSGGGAASVSASASAAPPRRAPPYSTVPKIEYEQVVGKGGQQLLQLGQHLTEGGAWGHVKGEGARA